jgi:tRNA A37 methylthiotransferase MiaB
MPQLAHEVIKARASRLRETASRRRARWLQSLVGTLQPILVEGHAKGHTDNFAPIAIEGARRGEAGLARITSADLEQATAVWA